MGECTTDPETVLVDETSFFTWLNGDQSCPTVADVDYLLQTYINESDPNLNSVITQQQAKLSSLLKTLNKRILDVQVAQDRATMVTRPEITASYYDGWFPLTRPLKQISIPILIGVATLLFTFAVILLLELLGIRLLLSVYMPFESMFNSSKFTGPFWTMTAVAGIFMIIIIYLFLR
jgi:hypothetical protein